MSTSVAFLWHMHQPVYKDMLSGSYRMPWVRLHALKAYYDMPRVLMDYPSVRQTFNIVPSLIMQLKDYEEGRAEDYFADIAKKPPEDLTPGEKKFMLCNFFMANWDTMIKPYARYWGLLNKRGIEVSREDIDTVVKEYTVSDYRDLAAWFNLSWFGFMARKDFPHINELISKGRGFTEDDIKIILDTQTEVIKKIIPLYKEMQNTGQIEISTSPFYHPIMPLLYDTDTAKRAMPYVSLPDRFRAPEDVVSHLDGAVSLYRDTFGRPPKGLWPSEGSICPELIPVIAGCGFRWFAADEDILLNTVRIKDKGTGLYMPYRFRSGRRMLSAVFRDKGISNALSFVYSKQDPDAAVSDLMRNFHNINDYLAKKGQDGLVTVVLDGENPWEYYPGGGEAFLRRLYAELTRDEDISAVTVSDYVSGHPPADEIKEVIYSGSWINHNFGIWIGGSEENEAWNCIKRARIFLSLEAEKGGVRQENLQRAWQCLYAAEGSDWFWWYGDDFSTDCDEEFDLIFRTHLANVYKSLGYDTPDYLKQSILGIKDIRLTQEPFCFINPSIDGVNTHYYEWSDAGYFDPAGPGRMPYKGRNYLSRIYMGFDPETLFLRIDPVPDGCGRCKNLKIFINIREGAECRIVFPLLIKEMDRINSFILDKSIDGIKFEKTGEYTSIKAKEIIELSIPFDDMGLKAGETVHLFLQIKRGNTEIERYPRRGDLLLRVPDADFELDRWNA